MERKIGEIFEQNGEWYQCVGAGFSCADCDIKGDCSDVNIGACSSSLRTDRKKVVFKKLEKVGEPYLAHDHSRNKDVVVQDYKLYNQHDCYNGREEMLSFGLYGRNGIVTIKSKEPIKSKNCEDSIEIQIKQNQEDMEEKKIELRQEDLTYIIGKIRCDILPKYTTYDEITDEIAKLFTPVNHVELSNFENIGKNLKPFDLEAARNGKPVCTRDGRKARIICFDAKFPKTGNIVALVEKKNGEEITLYYYDDGHCSIGNGYDLMMLPEKHQGWVNVYKGGLLDTKAYDTKNDAFGKASPKDYIATVKIEWYE